MQLRSFSPIRHLSIMQRKSHPYLKYELDYLRSMIRQKSSLREIVTIECIPNLLPTRRQFSYLEERVTIHDDPFSVSRSPFSPSNENERHAEKEREIDRRDQQRSAVAILSPSPELNPPVAESDRSQLARGEALKREHVYLSGALMPR